MSWLQLLQTFEAIFAARPVVGLSLGGVAVGSATRQTARVVARLLNWLLACYALHSLKVTAQPQPAQTV